jgi:non-ribosomal peptide synthase protein (TIGR01720 family)
MVPTHFVQLAELPLTNNGKVDRRALPAPPTAVKITENVQPRETKERILLGIWQQILGSQEIGIYDNFFDLGGDSISGMQIVSLAHQKGLHLTPAQLFQHQTIADQAAVAKEQKPVRITAVPAVGEVPLSPIQWDFFQQDLPNLEHYNQAVMLTAKAGINLSFLQSALESLVQHHDGLRLRFDRTANGWRQTYAAPETVLVPFEQIDLTADDAPTLDGTITQLQTSLNLSQGPLFRGALLTLAPGESGQRLLLIAHHLLVDGVSWRILLADLLTAYRQAQSAQALSLPEKTTAFGEWTAHLQAQGFRKEYAYWAETCRPTLALPVDEPLGRNTVADSRELVVVLEAAQTAALQALNVPVNVVLLTALAQTLRQWSQNDTITLDMEGHGRRVWNEDLDLSRTVGWFTVRYPLKLSLPSGLALNEQLNQVKGQLAQVPNEGVGYGTLRAQIGQGHLFNADSGTDSGTDFGADWGENTLKGVTNALISPAEISFNYLGQLNLDASSIIAGLAPEPVVAVKSEEGDRLYRLEVVAFIEQQQLQIRWCYSQQQYQQRTLEQLSQQLLSNLKSLITYCNRPRADSVNLANVSAARVNTDQLSQLMGKLQAREGR